MEDQEQQPNLIEKPYNLYSNKLIFLYQFSNKANKNKKYKFFVKCVDAINGENPSTEIEIHIPPDNIQILGNVKILGADIKFKNNVYIELSYSGHLGSRQYASRIHSLMDEGNFFWNFEFHKNQNLTLFRSPKGKPIMDSNIQILGFLYYIFGINQPFDINLLASFVYMIKKNFKLMLSTERINDLLEIILHCKKALKIPKENMSTGVILSLSLLSNHLRLPDINTKLVKEMDLLSLFNDMNSNPDADNDFKKWYQKGLTLIFLIMKAANSQDIIVAFEKLQHNLVYFSHIVKNLIDLEFKMPALSKDLILANDFYCIRNEAKMKVLRLLLTGLNDPLTSLEVIGEFFLKYENRVSIMEIEYNILQYMREKYSKIRLTEKDLIRALKDIQFFQNKLSSPIMAFLIYLTMKSMFNLSSLIELYSISKEQIHEVRELETLYIKMFKISIDKITLSELVNYLPSLAIIDNCILASISETNLNLKIFSMLKSPITQNDKANLENILLSKLLYPEGSITLIIDLVQETFVTFEQRYFLILSAFLPQRHDAQFEFYLSKLKDILKIVFNYHNQDKDNLNKLFSELIQVIEVELSAPIIKWYLNMYLSSNTIKDILQLVEYKILVCQYIFRQEYFAFVDEKIFMFYRPDKNNHEFEILTETETNKIDKVQMKNLRNKLDLFIKDLLEYYSPKKKDSQIKLEFKDKLLNSLLVADTIQANLITYLSINTKADQLWFNILHLCSENSGRHHININAIADLFKNIKIISNEIFENTINYGTIKAISMFGPFQKSRFFEYISLASEGNVDKKSTEQIHKAVEDNINKMKQIAKITSNYDMYSKRVASMSKTGAELVEEINTMLNKLDATSLKDFDLSPLCKAIQDPVQKYCYYSASICYKNYYMDEIKQLPYKSPLEISIEEYNICILKAHEKFLTLKYTLKDFHKWKITDLQKLFQGLCDANFEITFLIKEDILNKKKGKALKNIIKSFGSNKDVSEVYKVLNNVFNLFGIPRGSFFKDLSQYIIILKEEKEMKDEEYENFSFMMEYLNKILALEELIQLIEELGLSKDLIEFINKLQDADITNMIDALDEHSESFLRVQSILELKTVKLFLNKIDKTSDTNFIMSLEKAFTTTNIFKGIEKMFNTCRAEINSVKNFYNQLTSREEASKKKIIDISKKSFISIKKLDSKKDSNSYTINIAYGENKIMNLSDVIELRDRALLIVNKENDMEAVMSSIQSNYDNESIQDSMRNINIESIKRLSFENPDMIIQIEDKLVDFNQSLLVKKFIQAIDNLIAIQSYLNLLEINGYPKLYQKEIEIINGNTDALDIFEKEIKNDLDYWKDCIKKITEKYPALANIYGRQYWIVEKMFAPNSQKYTRLKGLRILKYAQKKITLSDIDKYIVEDEDEYDKIVNMELQERLELLAKKVTELLKKYEGKDVKRIESNSPLSYHFEKGKILLIKSDKYSIIEKVLTIYSRCHEIHNYPKPNQILFCNPHSTFETIRTFLSLCFFDNKSLIYTIANVDQLSFELQDYFIQMFRAFHKENKDKEKPNNFRLAIITAEHNSHIFNHFSQYPITFSINEEIYPNQKELSDLVFGWGINTLVVASNRTGLGKSHYISSLASEKSQRLTIFPITGNVNLATYAKRLHKILWAKNDALHLDIGSIDDPIAINQFLFMIICLKAFKINNHSYIVGNSNFIYIEIPNTWSNMIQKSLTFCQYLPFKHFDQLNLTLLNPGIDPLSPMQIVCNFLQLYNQKKLNITDVNFEDPASITVFDKNSCCDLLNKYFITKKKEGQLTFRQISSFCKLLASQLKHMSQYYLSVQGISDIFGGVQNPRIKNITENFRSKFFEELMTSAIDLTCKSFESVSNTQDLALEQLNKPENETEINKEINKAISNSIVNWHSSNHLSIVFDKEGVFTVVYRDLKQIPDNLRAILISQNYKFIQNEGQLQKILLDKSNNSMQGEEILRDYSKLHHNDFLNLLKDICGMHINENEQNDLLTEYVLTPDNFLKMILILTQIKANIPVIIMGETGCGKTSLVKFLAINVLNQEFDVFNIHAGITETIFLKRIEESIEKAQLLKKTEKTYWLFLDEFNTCDSIGLINEMICKQKLLGKPLPNNLRLIAACNPYKIKSSKIDVGLVQKKTSSRLAHKVHPLPYSIMDYIWDFGSLQPAEERKYILNMLAKLKLEQSTYLLAELVWTAQEFLRNLEDANSVSLRDVKRFKIIFSWFKDSLQIRPKPNFPSKKDNTKWSYWKKNVNLQNEAGKRAMILAFSHCYLYRIAKKSDRLALMRKAIDIIKNHRIDMNEQLFIEICNDEEEDYLNRMNLPKGIALNTALRENIFTALVCIMTKIPCFICGKPGSSKTLTVQLLVSNLRGIDSPEPFFRTLPEIYIITFQGSESSTSEAVEKAFEKAHNVLKKSSKERHTLPLVFFDEMGLAELSPNNPLKVLHSLLEPTKAEIAFIGISNWRLDASKMNRMIYLARPDPDQHDLESTAISIYQSYTDSDKYLQLMKTLSQTYFKYKLQSSKDTLPDFHGSRDFHSLIKQVTSDLLIEMPIDPKKIFESVILALQRNFSGRKDSSTTCLKIFKDLSIPPNSNIELKPLPIVKLIQANLIDKNARYLMIITRGDSASYILDKYFNHIIQKKVTIIGSKFAEDSAKDEYSFRVLSDIILYMEKGWTLILKGLDNIYGSLYDLFNQSFAIIGKRKNCRIALGSVANPMCIVDDDFRCIVLIDEKEVIQMEPPFLNRFEKHILNFENIMSDKQLDIAEKLYTWVIKITTLKHTENFDKIPIQSLIPHFNSETVLSLVLLNDIDNNKNVETLLKKCKNDLIKTSSIYQVILLHVSLLQDYPEEIQYFLQVYFDKEDNPNDLLELIKTKFYNENNQIVRLSNAIKVMVYTYDDIMEDITGLIGEPQQNGIKYCEIKMGIFISEKDLRKTLSTFFKSDDDIMIIRIQWKNEHKYISLLNYLIDKMIIENNGMKNPKHFLVIMHIEIELQGDKFNTKESLNYLAGWYNYTLDSLRGKNMDLIKDLIDITPKQIIKSGKFLAINKEVILKILHELYFRIKFIPALNTPEEKEKLLLYIDKVLKLMESLDEKDEIWKILKDKLVEGINIMSISDWKQDIFSNKELAYKNLMPLEILKHWIRMQIEKPLFQLLLYVEKNSAFESYLAAKENPANEKIHKKLWINVLKGFKYDMSVKLQKINHSIEIKHIDGLRFPFSYREFFYILDKEFNDVDKKEGLRNIFEEIKMNQIKKKLRGNNEDDLEVMNLNESTQRKLLNALEYCKEISSYKNDFDQAVSSPLLKDYLHDIVIIFLNEKLKKPNIYATLILLILEKLMDYPDIPLIEYYYNIYRYQEFFLKIIEMIEIYNKIVKLNELIAVFYKELPDEYIGRNKQEAWLGILIDKISETIRPSKDIFDKLKTFDSYFTYLQIIHVFCFSMQFNIGIIPNNISEIQFWYDFIANLDFFTEEKDKITFIIEIYDISCNYPGFLTNEIALVNIDKKLDIAMNLIPNANQEQNNNKIDSIDKTKTMLYYSFLSKSCGKNYIFEKLVANPRLLKFSRSLINFITNSVEISNNLEFLLEESSTLDLLEVSIKESGLEGPFSCLLLESFISKISHANNENQDIQKILSVDGIDYERLLNNAQIILDKNLSDENGVSRYPGLYVIAVCSIIKKLLKFYAYAILGDTTLPQNIHNKYSNILISQNKLASTLRFYVSKILHSRLGSISKFTSLLLNNPLTKSWGIMVNFGNIQSLIDICPFPIKQKDFYKKFEKNVMLLMRTGMKEAKALQDFTKMIEEGIKDPRTKLCILQFFTNKVYFLHLMKELTEEMINIRKWFTSNEKSILKWFGGDMLSFEMLKNYIFNFPKAPNYSLSEKTNIKKVQEISVQMFLFNLVICFRNQSWPFSDLFFAQGQLPKNLAKNLENYYIIGLAETPEIDNLVALTKLNYVVYTDEQIRKGNWNTNIGCALYKCSDTCDYFYTVGNCTRVTVNTTVKCPSGHLLGGYEYNKPHKRPGHEKIWKDEKLILNNVIERKRKEEKTGYHVFSNDQNKDYAPRGLTPIAYRILRYFLYSIMNIFMISNLIPKEQFVNIHDNFKHNNYLETQMQAHWENLSKLLENNENSNLYIMMNGILSSLCEIIFNTQYSSKSQEGRNKFELDFTSKLVDYHIQNMTKTIKFYREEFGEDSNNASDVPKILEIIDIKLINPKINPLQLIFRKTKEIDWKKFKSDFLVNEKNKKTNAFLNLFFEKEEDLESLTCLLPLARFTNAAINYYNHRITRNDATKTLTIKDFLQENPFIKRTFQQFKDLWNKYLVKEMRLGCKEYTKQVISEDSPLVLILVDSKKENGSGIHMTAAFCLLATIQNEFLKAAQNISISNKNLKFLGELDSSKYAIQYVLNNDIIAKKSSDDLDSLVQSYYSFNHEFGKGEEVYYDYDMIEYILARDLLLGKKFLNDTVESLTKIQYQFELLNIQGESSNLISEVRKALPQEEMSLELTKLIHTELDSFMKDNNNEKKGIEKLKAIFSSLCLLLCLVKNSYKKEDLTIEKYCNLIDSSRISDYITKNNILSSISLCNLVGLYEIIEMKLFDSILMIVPDFFKDSFSVDLSNEFKTFVDQLKDESLPSIPDMIIFTKRFIIRCLDADLSPDQDLLNYIYREDFWPNHVTDDMRDNLAIYFPKSIKLAHSAGGFLKGLFDMQNLKDNDIDLPA